MAPLQLFTFIGVVVSLLSGLLVLYLAIDRIIAGPQVQGVFSSIWYFVFPSCIALMGLGIAGEYKLGASIKRCCSALGLRFNML